MDFREFQPGYVPPGEIYPPKPMAGEQVHQLVREKGTRGLVSFLDSSRRIEGYGLEKVAGYSPKAGSVGRFLFSELFRIDAELAWERKVNHREDVQAQLQAEYELAKRASDDWFSGETAVCKEFFAFESQKTAGKLADTVNELTSRPKLHPIWPRKPSGELVQDIKTLAKYESYSAKVQGMVSRTELRDKLIELEGPAGAERTEMFSTLIVLGQEAIVPGGMALGFIGAAIATLAGRPEMSCLALAFEGAFALTTPLAILRVNGKINQRLAGKVRKAERQLKK